MFPNKCGDKITNCIGEEIDGALLPNYEEILNDDNAFQNHYNHIWRTREGCEKEKAFWIGSGKKGAEFLCKIIREEYNAEVLVGVANILADIGQISIGPIMQELCSCPKPDQCDGLLEALGYMDNRNIDSLLMKKIENIIRYHIDSEYPDVRESAMAATRFLPHGIAIDILQERFKKEKEDYVRISIKETIEEHLDAVKKWLDLIFNIVR